MSAEEFLDRRINELRVLVADEPANVQALGWFMSHLSEENWCAGWLIDLEHVLWDEIAEPTRISNSDALRLAAMAKACGRWCVFQGSVSLEEWMPMHEAWTKQTAELAKQYAAQNVDRANDD